MEACWGKSTCGNWEGKIKKLKSRSSTWLHIRRRYGRGHVILVIYIVTAPSFRLRIYPGNRCHHPQPSGWWSFASHYFRTRLPPGSLAPQYPLRYLYCMHRMANCELCGGSGVDGGFKCTLCGGKGSKRSKTTLVRILNRSWHVHWFNIIIALTKTSARLRWPKKYSFALTFRYPSFLYTQSG